MYHARTLSKRVNVQEGLPPFVIFFFFFFSSACLCVVCFKALTISGGLKRGVPTERSDEICLYMEKVLCRN